MAEDLLPKIFCTAVLALLPAGRTEDRYGGTFSERRLENAERCVCGSLDAGSGSTEEIEKNVQGVHSRIKCQ